MSETPDTTRYDALGEDARRYVDAAAKAIFLVDRGLDGKAGPQHWEREVEGTDDGSPALVAGYRLKGLAVVEALAAMTAPAVREDTTRPGDGTGRDATDGKADDVTGHPVPPVHADAPSATMQ